MDKLRKWQFLLILTVIALTIYNILPTLFYYLKPLHSPVSPSQAIQIAENIEQRISGLEKEAKEWLSSYCDLLRLSPHSISIDPNNPEIVVVSFSKLEEAERFRNMLPRAGSLIPFAPSQLVLALESAQDKDVLVQRKIPLRLQKEDFFYASKNDLTLLRDRLEQIVLAITGQSESALILNTWQKEFPPSALERLTSQINAISEAGLEGSPLEERFLTRFTHGILKNRKEAVQALIDACGREKNSLQEAKKHVKEEESQNLRILEKKEKSLANAERYLKSHLTKMSEGNDPRSPSILQKALENQHINFGNIHPLFSELFVDFQKDQILLKFHQDVAEFRKNHHERFEQLLIHEIAAIRRLVDEEISPSIHRDETEISIPLHHLVKPSGYLVLDQAKLAKRFSKQLETTIRSLWHPHHPDLQNLPIVDEETYQTLPQEQKALCLVITSPLLLPPEKRTALHPHSLYVTAKGIDKVLKTYEAFPNSKEAIDFYTDFRNLSYLLQNESFFGYPETPPVQSIASIGDFLFEKPHFSSTLLAATREDFHLHGTGKLAYIELGDVEGRIGVENRIETKIHEDLLKWKDEYRTAQVSLDPRLHFDVPKPTKSVFWSNFLLSARKYFRGDDRKIIKWGLDLSGGKSIQIELKDSNHQTVTNDADLKQGINELFNRVNKMGVSEVSIRQIGHQIALDFPGSQAISASELIKAATMSFHVVNEKFSPANPVLSESVNRFLQEVWNEASVTGKKDIDSINEIALRHLEGEIRSEAAEMLSENGLKLTSWRDPQESGAFDDSISKIAIFRGSDFSKWHGQSHPLLIIFRNWALEGADLENIRAGYDPDKGNFLSFAIAGSTVRGGQKIHPRQDLFAWTSRYSKEKILGTSLEAYSKGRGWRMAAVLNDAIISTPALEAALKDSAMISGSFSQSEVGRLVSDLKAGSLTFTPKILSEKNVSPELGKTDRLKGITATIVALLLVVGSMVAYYRFSGAIASVAVLFNLLILWATLQNLGATLTLAGLAGVILTVGMAVDANVLVFERVKEEFAISKQIRSALKAGYKKAYSAILDSNVTTIIAALILLNFDAGPIKSFAVNLIIGIASSMFTALFMTRFYFTRWVENPKHTTLKMANWIRSTHFNFLKWAKVSFALATLIIVIGCTTIWIKRSSIFGMDFTGGYAVEFELPLTSKNDYAKDVEKALLNAGAALNDFQIREMNPENHLRLLLGTSLELPGKPFHKMPLENEGSQNPRIHWILQALQTEGISLTPQSLHQLSSSWNAMSGQMSQSMRNHALFGLSVAFLCIFIYLAFRFEYKFATAALLCLFHDVFITLGILGILHVFGVSIQIDLSIIAALMTIIGYSLNDTIIIFDRIREEMQKNKKGNFLDLVNTALNATLSRTTITSGTTLLVLIALVLFGGPSIFGFSLVMTIGVIAGTLSSWFIASPLMILFHKREQKKETSLQPQ